MPIIVTVVAAVIVTSLGVGAVFGVEAGLATFLVIVFGLIAAALIALAPLAENMKR